MNIVLTVMSISTKLKQALSISNQIDTKLKSNDTVTSNKDHRSIFTSRDKIDLRCLSLLHSCITYFRGFWRGPAKRGLDNKLLTRLTCARLCCSFANEYDEDLCCEK